jgi:hypothetical protein
VGRAAGAHLEPRPAPQRRPFADAQRVAALVRAAELSLVATRVGDEPLGADGGLLSGGDGQRVRLARALNREDVRLAVLDEPLRGLDRAQRHRLLATARERWRNATLLCATHDIGEAMGFERIIVLEDGRVVADGRPDTLLAAPDSALRAMLDAEQALRDELDRGRGWRRLRVQDGTLREEQPNAKTDGDAASTPGVFPAPRHEAATPVGEPSRDRAAPACAVFVTASVLRYTAFAASWSVIGTAILGGGGAGLTTWALLLGATVPLAALAEAAEGRRTAQRPSACPPTAELGLHRRRTRPPGRQQRRPRGLPHGGRNVLRRPLPRRARLPKERLTAPSTFSPAQGVSR